MYSHEEEKSLLKYVSNTALLPQRLLVQELIYCGPLVDWYNTLGTDTGERVCALAGLAEIVVVLERMADDIRDIPGGSYSKEAPSSLVKYINNQTHLQREDRLHEFIFMGPLLDLYNKLGVYNGSGFVAVSSAGVMTEIADILDAIAVDLDALT